MSYPLEVCDLRGNKIALLNDNSEHKARNITLEGKVNAVSELTFEMPLSSKKWIYIKNEYTVLYMGESYIIKTPSFQHDKDKKLLTVTCCHLSDNLNGKVFISEDLIAKTASDLMAKVLDGTGWKVGTVITNGKLRSLEKKEQSALSALVEIAEKYDAELNFNSSTLTVDLVDTKIDRQIYFFTGKNIKDIKVDYDSNDLITAIIPFGGQNDAGEEINIMKVSPDNSPKIMNFDYYMSQGLTLEECKTHPEKYYKEMIWRASEYVNAQDLYDDAVKKLATLSKPKVKVTLNAMDLAHIPEYRTSTPILGEIINIIDVDLNLKMSAKVVSIKKNYDNETDLSIEVSNEIEYNSVVRDLVDTSKLTQAITDGLGHVKGSYINGIIDIVKAKLNSTESGFRTDDKGALLFENKVKDANGHPISAMKLTGAGFEIANSWDSVANDYNWRTFGDGKGFVADCIIAGAIVGGKCKFDLEEGTFLIGNSPTDYKLYFDGNELNIKFDDTHTYKSKLNEVDSNVSSLTDRIQKAEIKITPEAITETVTHSEVYAKQTRTPSSTTMTLTSGVSPNPLNLFNPINIQTFNVNTPVIIGRKHDLVYSVDLCIVDNSVNTFSTPAEQAIKTEAKISVQADRISQVVSETNQINGDNIISSINQSSRKIDMNALNIDLTGYVTFNSLSTPNSTTIVDGSNVRTGKVSADYIDVANLKVSSANITGKLIASQIDVDNLTVRSANFLLGTINASQINAGEINGCTLRAYDTDLKTEINIQKSFINYKINSSEKLRVGYADVPVVGSINGVTFNGNEYIAQIDATHANQITGNLSNTMPALAMSAVSDLILASNNNIYLTSGNSTIINGHSIVNIKAPIINIDATSKLFINGQEYGANNNITVVAKFS